MGPGSPGQLLGTLGFEKLARTPICACVFFSGCEATVESKDPGTSY